MLLLVILVWVRAGAKLQESNSAWDPAPPQEDESAEACASEYVSRIFSDEDLDFIARLESPYLERLFRRERNAVAHHWVHRTSAAISQIMREHLETSRQSHDLEFATEAGIFLRYAELKLICAVLSAGIELAGPQRLRGLATHADRLTQGIGDVQRALAAATQSREIGGAAPR